MRRSSIIAGLLLCCAHHSFGQHTDTLRQVNKSSRQWLPKPAASLRSSVLPDSSTLAYYRNESLATLLAQQSYSFVRQYGTNGPSSLLLRGASAAQTAVRWNGIPLQNGATGIVDLSLIPVAAINNVSIELGSAGSTAGSGAMGGVLYLNTPKETFDGACSIAGTLAGGSFGTFIASGKVTVSSTKWFGFLGLQHQQAKNDFCYTDVYGNQARLSNARINGTNMEAGIARKLGRKDVLAVALWTNLYDRQIPPALFESYSVKRLKDASLQSVLSWQHSNAMLSYGVQSSVIHDWFDYSDSAIHLRSKYETQQIYGALWVKKYLPHHVFVHLQMPLQYNYFVGGDHQSIRRAAVVASVQKTFYSRSDTAVKSGTDLRQKATISANSRAEAIEDKTVILGDLLAAYSIVRSFSIRASIGNTYRYPTLNERYYFPGGNKSLRPETGWSAEAGYDWKPAASTASVTFAHSGTAYYRDVDDWIIWYGGAIWTPHNIAEVLSKGFETDNKLSWRRPNVTYYASAGGSLISSTTFKSAVPGDASIGHQIPYAPRLIAQGNIGFNTPHWRASYNQTYTADRYYNSDETGLLPSFATGNMQAGWLRRYKSWNIDLAATIQNLWNARYAEVSGRPAMGRNFLLSCTIVGAK